MDGDFFSSVTRVGGAAAEAIFRALQREEDLDPFLAEKCLDDLFNAVGGVPSLPLVLEEVGKLERAPLLVHLEAETALGRIRDSTLLPSCNQVDLVLESVAVGAVMRGDLARENLLVRYCSQLLDRLILSSRGGFLERYGFPLIEDARALLAPIARRAAAVLNVRPDAKRLGLARAHATVQPSSDLLGGFGGN